MNIGKGFLLSTEKRQAIEEMTHQLRSMAMGTACGDLVSALQLVAGRRRDRQADKMRWKTISDRAASEHAAAL
ncbi:MAG: hypothetical protein Q7T69_20745 [Rhodoferax sp.]|nr:hypothetical protein [Rhodoferax sp.]